MHALGKRRKASLLLFRTAIEIGNPDVGIDSGFVDIETVVVFTKDLESQFEPPKEEIGELSRDWLSGKIETICKR